MKYTYPSIDFGSELSDVHPLLEHLSFFPDLLLIILVINDILFILDRLIFFFLFRFIFIGTISSFIFRDITVEKLNNLIFALLKLFLSH
jgi:hypothetical protein